jgi:hypothetical protein
VKAMQANPAQMPMNFMIDHVHCEKVQLTFDLSHQKT